MSRNYQLEFKKKIVFFSNENDTSKDLPKNTGVSKASISIWVKQFREECQTNEEAKVDYDYMKENLQLRKQLTELQKENEFLKKRRHSLRRKSISGLSIYSEIQQEIWTSMASEKVSYLPKCILQLSQKAKSGLSQTKRRNQRHHWRNLPRPQRSRWLQKHACLPYS